MPKLIEGKYYKFRVVGNLSISNENYFILDDIFAHKHLLDKKLYPNYKIELNQNLNCKVDKINCQGRIFLEPEHPFYKIGKTYQFKFKTKRSIKNKKGFIENQLIFIDIFNQEAVSVVKNEQFFNSFNQQIHTCKVLKIKKGKVFVECEL